MIQKKTKTVPNYECDIHGGDVKIIRYNDTEVLIMCIECICSSGIGILKDIKEYTDELK